jgi:hypothetical protein
LLRTGAPARIFWGLATHVYRAPEVGPNGQPAFVVERSREWFRWTWCDGIQFWVHAVDPEVLVHWPVGEGPESAAYYFVGPILAFILRRRGLTLLHGSVVDSAAGAIAFLGESGAGKSTLAAAMLRCGYGAVTDDVIALDARDQALRVWPGFAGLRLWQDSAQAVAGHLSALPRLVTKSRLWPDWDKRLLRLDAEPGPLPTEPRPIRYVYILDPGDTGPARIESLPVPRQVMEMERNTYQRFLRDGSRMRMDFVTFGRLAEQATIRRLVRGESLRDIGYLTSLLTEDMARH